MNRQVDKKKTMQVRIDTEWLYYAKAEAAKQRRTVKSLVEEGLELVMNTNGPIIMPNKESRL